MLDLLPSPATLEGEDDRAFLARMAREVVRRGMATPAILFLESMKPMNFVGSRFLLFMDPVVRMFMTIPDYGRCARLLENRDTLERLLCAIEECEDEARARRADTAAREVPR